MVLDAGFARSVNNGDTNAVVAWLDGLERPEDINEVDEDGKTVLILILGPAAGLGLHDSRGANRLLGRWRVRRPGRPESPRVLDAARRVVLGPTDAWWIRTPPPPTGPGRPYRVRRPLGPQRDRGPRGAPRGCGAEGGRDYSALERLGL